jgi:dihydrofolate synthase/folylpolyglutamate synthase
MDNRLETDPHLAFYLKRFESYHAKAMDFGLSRTLRLMHDLGHPHLRVPPVIHVAGTNGKGSTIAFLKAILNEIGLKCHVMTSPHLVEYRERFVIADHMISNNVLADYMKRIDDKNAGQSATFFELITAVGFELFAHHNADIALIETGMGGRLDTTNIIPAPLVTVITMISMDHTQHLGDTIQKIAAEKAGIMKENVPCVIGVQTEQALSQHIHDVFEIHARALNVPLYRHGIEWNYHITDDGFIINFKGEIYHLPRPSLLGAHQYANAATAFVTFLVAQMGDAQIARHGIAKTSWQARLQKLNHGNLKNLMDAYDECWLDGGHNDTAGAVLADQIMAWNKIDNKQTHLIVGMLNTKNPMEFLSPMKDLTASITCITIPDQPLSLSAHDLAHKTGGTESPSLHDAVASICTNNTAPKRILIAGSLYLAGHVLMLDKIEN